MYRKRLIPFVLIFLLALPCAASANGGPGEGYGYLMGGGVVFVDTPDILLAKEVLTISLSPKTSVVTAEYTLKNEGPARDVQYYFPISQYFSELYSTDPLVEWIAFYDGEKKIACEAIVEQTPQEQTVSEDGYAYYPSESATLGGVGIDYSYIENIYYKTTLHFESAETKILTVKYKGRNSFTSASWSGTLLTRYSDITFLYDLRPAASWGNGKAGEFDLTIDYSELHYADGIKINLPGFSREPSGIYHYHAENYDFQKQGVISAVIGYPLIHEDLERFRKSNDVLDEVYVSSTLDSKEERYGAANLFDGDPDTAWASAGEGKGETIEILPETPGGDGCAVLGILNGYVKSEKAYYDNARIKKLLIEFYGWHPDEGILYLNDTMEVDLPDIPYTEIEKGYLYNTLPLIDPKNLYYNFIRLTVLDVYPGRKYQDLCISEIVPFLWTEAEIESGYEIAERSILERAALQQAEFIAAQETEAEQTIPVSAPDEPLYDAPAHTNSAKYLATGLVGIAVLFIGLIFILIKRSCLKKER